MLLRKVVAPMLRYRVIAPVLSCSFAAAFALSACSGNAQSGAPGAISGDSSKISGVAALPAVAGRSAARGRMRGATAQPTCSGTGTDAFVGGTDANVDAGDFSVVTGGIQNDACSTWATVGGGEENGIDGSSQGGAIGGGALNAVLFGKDSTIAGGASNTSSGEYTTIAGGFSNTTQSLGAIGGGDYNLESGNLDAIGGGFTNTASNNYAAIGGGSSNVASGQYSSIAGGLSNNVSGQYGFVGSGDGQAVGAEWGTVAGGHANKVTAGNAGTIGGGWENQVTNSEATVSGGETNQATGLYATVPGGQLNVAAGKGSFAAGMSSNAAHDGDFVWSDASLGTAVKGNGDNQFLARSSGGVTFYSSANLASGVSLAPGSGTWSSLSDRNVKTGIVPINDDGILAKVAMLPISEWSYTTERGVRHVGPMAQDFYASFDVGEDNRHITSIDEDGVALAAIKALDSKLAQKDGAIHSLQLEDARLQRRMAKLEARLDAMPGSPR